MHFHRQHYLVLWRLLFWALSAIDNPMLGIYRIFIHSYWVMCVSVPVGHNNCIRVIFVPWIILPTLSCHKEKMYSDFSKKKHFLTCYNNCIRVIFVPWINLPALSCHKEKCIQIFFQKWHFLTRIRTPRHCWKNNIYKATGSIMSNKI